MTLKTVCSHEGGGCVLKKNCCDLLRVKLAALQFSNSLYDFFSLFRLPESKQIVFNAKIKPCVSLSYDFSNYRAVNGRIAYVSNMSSSL